MTALVYALMAWPAHRWAAAQGTMLAVAAAQMVPAAVIGMWLRQRRAGMVRALLICVAMAITWSAIAGHLRGIFPPRAGAVQLWLGVLPVVTAQLAAPVLLGMWLRGAAGRRR